MITFDVSVEFEQHGDNSRQTISYLPIYPDRTDDHIRANGTDIPDTLLSFGAKIIDHISRMDNDLITPCRKPGPWT